MLIVIEALTERPIYRYAAKKAGIHRKTLENWLRCSEAGHGGYEVEWGGFTLPFHEHCATAKDIAYETLREIVWETARGVRVRIEDGKLMEERIGPPNGKMIRFYFTLERSPQYRKDPEFDYPRPGGVLIVGAATNPPQTCPPASIRARRWKSGMKKATAGRA
jgi:hypothetical protein